jgi:hypothetical protein
MRDIRDLHTGEARRGTVYCDMELGDESVRRVCLQGVSACVAKGKTGMA